MKKLLVLSLLLLPLLCFAGPPAGFLGTDESGQLPVTNFYLEVAKGNVPGHTHVNKYGHNEEITTASDPEDVWGGDWLSLPNLP